MKTDDLIGLLATGIAPVERGVVQRRYAAAIGFGFVGAILLMLMLLRVRSDLSDAVFLPMFWAKLGYVASLAGAGLFAAIRLSRPGARLEWVPVSLAVPMLAMGALAGNVLFAAEPAERLPLLLGSTWQICPFLIAVLSLPAFVSLIWAMKGLAPTRPRLAGASAGFLAGATAALVYSVHCPEMAAPFIGFWYFVGMLIPTVLGAVVGGRLLRW